MTASLDSPSRELPAEARAHLMERTGFDDHGREIFDGPGPGASDGCRRHADEGHEPERGVICSILDRVHSGLTGETTSVGDIVASLEDVSFSAVLLLLAVVVVSPLSGIPVLPSICGISIGLLSGQMILRRRHIWLPGWIMARHVSTARVRSSLALMERLARLLDRISRRRLEFVMSPPLSVLPKLLSMTCGLAMPFLELVPFTSSILGLVVSVLALSMIVRDGLLMLVGTSILFALVGATVAFIAQWI